MTKIEQELKLADKSLTSRPIPYTEWSLDFLCDYIVNTHHSYVKQSLPDLVTYATKVEGVHSPQHPELHKIKSLVDEINAELTAHMMKEEIVLFPYIKELVSAKKNEQVLHASHFGTVQNPINMMEMEHEIVGQKISKKLEDCRTIIHFLRIAVLPIVCCIKCLMNLKMICTYISI